MKQIDYKDYSDLDPILPPEGSLQAVPAQHITRIPGLKEVD